MEKDSKRLGRGEGSSVEETESEKPATTIKGFLDLLFENVNDKDGGIGVFRNTLVDIRVLAKKLEIENIESLSGDERWLQFNKQEEEEATKG